MLALGNCSKSQLNALKNLSVKYSSCCPSKPSKPPCGCGPKGHTKLPPQSKSCRPSRIPPNPCVPRFHEGKDTWKKYKFISIFICLPLIAVLTFNALSHELPPKQPCRDYEYMRIRTKKYPWGTGNETFFHNEHVNHLPGECEPPPLDCD